LCPASTLKQAKQLVAHCYGPLVVNIDMLPKLIPYGSWGEISGLPVKNILRLKNPTVERNVKYQIQNASTCHD